MGKKRPLRGEAGLKTENVTKWIQFAIAIAIFIGGMFTNAVSISKNIASVDLVESRYKSAISYTDTKVSDAIKEVREYSDKNRLVMEKALAEQTGLLREQGASVKNMENWVERLSNRMNQVIDLPGPRRK